MASNDPRSEAYTNFGLASDIGEIKGTLKSLVKAVMGNGQPGLVQTVQEHGEEITLLKGQARWTAKETAKEKAKRTALEIAAWGFALSVLWKLLYWALTHHWPNIP